LFATHRCGATEQYSNASGSLASPAMKELTSGNVRAHVIGRLALFFWQLPAMHQSLVLRCRDSLYRAYAIHRRIWSRNLVLGRWKRTKVAQRN
jgi:hypothetical protein